MGTRNRRAEDVLDTVLDFVPIVGGGKDIYQGIQDGNGWMVALGVGSIILDVGTLGGSSIVKGLAKTGIKAGGRSLTKKAAKSALKKGAKARRAARGVGNALKLRPDIILSGGRSGQLVKNLTGPANSVLKGGGNRMFITDDVGKVIWDVTTNRAKPVVPGKGFGPKVTPTQEQLNLLNKIWGN